MSIYSKPESYPQTYPRRDQPPKETSAELEEQYKRLRKLSPVDVPLPRTLRWIESLTPGIQLTAVLRHYPRIANLIATTWSNPESFDNYMESLLVDRRGNRQGFTPEVLSELINLYRFHKLARQDARWDAIRKLAE